MSREEFIHKTVGEEVRRACEHIGASEAYAAFKAADTSKWARVYIFWWRGSTFAFGHCYNLSLPGTRVLPFDSTETEYVADAELPEAWSLSLLIVAYPVDVEDTGLPESTDPEEVERILRARGAFVAAEWHTTHLSPREGTASEEGTASKELQFGDVPIEQFTDGTVESVVALARLVMTLGEVPRITLHADKVTLETVTTHTTMLAVVACSIAYRMGLDAGRIAELCLVHDMAEAILKKDTPTLRISESDRAAKAAREDAAVGLLYRAFRLSSPWLCARLREYEERTSLEACVVDIVDKATPKLSQHINEGASVLQQGVTADELRVLHDEQYAKFELLYGHEPRLRFALVFLRASMDGSLAVVTAQEAKQRGEP